MRGLAILFLAGLAACGGVTNPDLAAKKCAERARAAAGPTGQVSLGVNNKSGAFTRARIGISSDFIKGRDPDAVYDACFTQLTGAAPTRRPVFR